MKGCIAIVKRVPVHLLLQHDMDSLEQLRRFGVGAKNQSMKEMDLLENPSENEDSDTDSVSESEAFSVNSDTETPLFNDFSNSDEESGR